MPRPVLGAPVLLLAWRQTPDTDLRGVFAETEYIDSLRAHSCSFSSIIFSSLNLAILEALALISPFIVLSVKDQSSVFALSQFIVLCNDDILWGNSFRCRDLHNCFSGVLIKIFQL